MAGLASSDFTDAMKTFYIGPLNDAVTRATVMLDRLESNKDDVSGNFAYIPIITSRNPGVGSRKDVSGSGPALPTAGRQNYDTFTFKMAMHYGRGQISGPVMRASKDNSGAFAKALDVEMKGLMERLPEDLNRQIWSYGHGRAGTVAGTQSTSTGIEFDSRSIFSMRIGDRVVNADITTGTVINGANMTVSNILRDQDSTGAASNIKHFVTFDNASGAVTVDTNAFYFGEITSGHQSRGQEMYGIPAIIDDGNIGADEGLGGATTPAETGEMLDGSLALGSVDRSLATNAAIRSTVLHHSSPGTLRPLTVSLMEQAFLSSINIGGAKEGNLEMISDPGTWATFGLLHVGDRRYNDFKETLEGGWIALMFDNRPYFFDRDCPRNKIWFMDMTSIFLLTQSGYELMDEDGAVLSRVADRDAYEFTLYRDVQMGTNNPSKNTLLADVTSTFTIEADT